VTHYYRRRWDEDRGDEHTDWGSSDWFFAVADDGYAERQIEVYENGPTKRYSLERGEDADGFLTYAPFDPDEWLPYLIRPQVFEQAWADGD
jgi:hypothetical protein